MTIPFSRRRSSVIGTYRAQVIDNDIKIGANPMEEVKKSIAAGASLKHVDTTADRSAPMIEKDVKIHENARPALFNELKSKAVASN